MKKNVLTLGLVVASAVALGGYTYAAQPITTSTDGSSTSVIGQWRSRLTKNANKGAQKQEFKGQKNEEGKKGFKGQKNEEGKKGFMKGDHKGGMGMRGMKKNSAVEAAFKANDYTAFVAAFNANTNKPTDATVPTQDKFNQMAVKYNKHTAKEAAIEANDYDAFVAANTPTREEFAQIVAKNAHRKAIETAITNKDYNAFVAAFNADTDKPANATVPTQDQFNKMIEKKAAKESKNQTQ